MADKTTYESEMNQSAHRPGMEGVVNRGDARDSSGNREGERRAVSAPTRSAFGADSASDPAPKAAPAPAAAPKTDPLSIVGATRDTQYSKIVDDATK